MIRAFRDGSPIRQAAVGGVFRPVRIDAVVRATGAPADWRADRDRNGAARTFLADPAAPVIRSDPNRADLNCADLTCAGQVQLSASGLGLPRSVANDVG